MRFSSTTRRLIASPRRFLERSDGPRGTLGQRTSTWAVGKFPPGHTAAGYFKGSAQSKKVGNLSGGERNRLQLAQTVRQAGNLLLLDEPTNDLDVDTLRALEGALLAFSGAAMVISHDRWFLDRVCTHILAFEGDSQTVWYDGSYSEYERDLRERTAGRDPSAVKYRPMPALG